MVAHTYMTVHLCVYNNYYCILSAERQARLAEVERRWEEKKQSLTEELARVEKLLAGAYDRSVCTAQRYTIPTPLHALHAHTCFIFLPPSLCVSLSLSLSLSLSFSLTHTCTHINTYTCTHTYASKINNKHHSHTHTHTHTHWFPQISNRAPAPSLHHPPQCHTLCPSKELCSHRRPSKTRGEHGCNLEEAKVADGEGGAGDCRVPTLQ